jgi:phosphate transport system permease protein
MADALRPQATPPAAELVRRAISGRRIDVGARLFEGILLLSLVAALAILVTLLADVVGRGWVVYAERGTEFLTSGNSRDPAQAGVGQALFGSLALMVIVAIVSFPLGIGAAIYLEEYARDTPFTRFITVNIRNLAGVPAIVYGLLGLAVFVIALQDLTGPNSQGRSIISGGLTLAIVVLPIVIITASEALRAVPGTIREAALGVGATRWEAIRSHVLPYAAPGILTGTILAMARAFGEAAPLIMVGGAASFVAAGDANLIDQLFGPYMAMPTLVYNWAGLPNQEFRALTSAGIMALLTTILLVNGIAIVLRNRYARRW